MKLDPVTGTIRYALRIFSHVAVIAVREKWWVEEVEVRLKGVDQVVVNELPEI